MKKFYLFISVFILTVVMSACSSVPTQFINNENEINLETAYTFENIVENKNYSDETLKALFVVLKNNESNVSISESFTPKIKTIEILNSVKDINILNKNTKILNNKNELHWSKTIKKDRILKYFQLKNISLSSISNVKPNIVNGIFESLDIGGKTLNNNEIATFFNLPSNTFSNLKNNTFSIEIEGDINDNYFILDEAENLANNGNTYLEILNYFNLK